MSIWALSFGNFKSVHRLFLWLRHSLIWRCEFESIMCRINALLLTTYIMYIAPLELVCIGNLLVATGNNNCLHYKNWTHGTDALFALIDLLVLVGLLFVLLSRSWNVMLDFWVQMYVILHPLIWVLISLWSTNNHAFSLVVYAGIATMRFVFHTLFSFHWC